MSSDYLPEDITEEILLRMESKILILCKFVCKSWNARISDPAFISKHLVRTQNQHHRILVLRGNRDTENNVISLLSSENPSDFQDLPYDMTFGNTEEGEDLQFGMNMLCCNHLLCISPYYSSTKIIIWNPKETEFKILPECHIPLDPPDAVRSNSVIGFGFDSETNDYKVVRMIQYCDHHVFYVLQMELYSFRNDSWRKLEAIPHITFDIISMGTLYINGMFYWYGSKGVQWGLCSLDMSTELIDITPLPLLEDSDRSYDSLDFFLLNDRPAMIQTFSGCQFEVWVLLVHGVRESWTRLYSIPISPEIQFPVGSWKSGELFTESEDGGLWLYDPITHEMKNLNIRSYVYSFQIVKYREQ